jgi:hypothetical protein
VPFSILDNIFGNRAEEKAANKKFKYDVKVWDYQFDEANRDYDFQVAGNQIARTNIDNNAVYQEQTALRQYQNELAIRDFDYGNQVRQFNESERIYGLQLGFNNQASQVAYEAENRRFQEILTGMAFEQQDMLVKMLQEEGQIQASGASGRSSGKALASAMASYGRNQAIMAESLVSATKENKISNRQIATEKYGADLGAQSRRMLTPLKGPAPMAPLKMPRAILQDPRQPVKPPKPIKGATSSLAGGIARGAANDIAMGLQIATMFSDARLKENVLHIGTAPSGISIYEWNYKWSKQRYRGVIAQDVLNFKPEAVVTMEPGFLGVNYGLIDVSMEPIA